MCIRHGVDEQDHNACTCAYLLQADGAGCFVSLAEFTSPVEAQQYINKIQLGSPPDHPYVDACGDDDKENQKAALYKMTELDPAVPTLAFMITDVAPHKGRDMSLTAQHERRWLEVRV